MRNMCVLILLLLLPLPPAELQLRTRPYIGPYRGRKSTNYYRNTWTNAQTFCKNKFADMITIRDEEDNKNYYSAHGWIGLYRENSTFEWKWSRRDEVANFLFWEDDLPDDGGNCAYKKNGELGWRRTSCVGYHYYLCQDEKLVLVKEEKTWEEALMHCRALEAADQSKPASAYNNYRYDMATLLTPDDHKFAQEKSHNATTDEVWTGLRYLAGYWLWVGGEDVNNKDLQSCTVDGFCGVLPKEGSEFYSIRSCHEKRNFLCYKKP
ncbi:uncharacterized protein [Labrus bergylta]|uniref:uncharacterized protein n=1 Tax=Labrus bergylta TaxID=56723 RepID=UPI003313FA2E